MAQSASHFDIIFSGAGCAGLSLLWHLGHAGWAGWAEQRILLIDPSPQTQNDRTWCFWEAGAGPFEAIVHRRWQALDFFGAADRTPLTLDIAPYAYKMIRGLDFYRQMGDWLATQPNVTVIRDKVLKISHDSRVMTHDSAYRGKLIFNSIANLPINQSSNPPIRQPITLLQHFRGWFIRSNTPIFDANRATLMDYRVPQHNDTRFVYIMPFDSQHALVEFTVFSPALLPRADYDAALQQYLQVQLGLSDGTYTIEDSEFGVIPMTDAPVQRNPAANVINIGTAGGRSKASTGYTFQRIQTDSQRIAKHMTQCAKQGRQPSAVNLAHALREPRRSRWIDHVMLNVLYKQRQPGHRVFSDLFRRNRASLLFKFLDEQSTLVDDLRVMSTVSLLPFIKAALDFH